MKLAPPPAPILRKCRDSITIKPLLYSTSADTIEQLESALEKDERSARREGALIVWTSQDALSVRASPTLNGSVLYVGAGDGVLYALDARTGTKIWSAAPDEPSGIDNHAPAVYGDRVFQARNNVFDDRIWAYDKKTGELLLSKRYNLDVSLTAAQDKLFAVARPNLVQLDQATGHEWWSAPLVDEGLR